MSTPSAFNPELLLNQQTSDSNSTELLLHPEGEFIGVIRPISAESFRSFDIKKGERAGQKGYSLDLMFDTNDDDKSLEAYLGRKPAARYSTMLDIKPDGTIETGKGRNVGLGRLREALGQNGQGRPWSFGMLGGQPIRYKVKHRLDTASGQTFAEVADVSKV